MCELYNNDPVKIRDAMRRKAGHTAAVRPSEEKKAEPAEIKKDTTPDVHIKFESKSSDTKTSDAKVSGVKTKEKPKKEPKKEQKKEPGKKTRKEPPLPDSTGPMNKTKVVATTLVLLLLTVLLICIINAVSGNVETNAFEVGYISRDEIVSRGEGTAYFVRNIAQVKCDADGFFLPKVKDGHRVEAGGIVGYIASEENKDIMKNLDDITSQILVLANDRIENNGDKELITPELEEVYKQIAEKEGELAEISKSGNFAGLAEIESELAELTEKKNELIIGAKSTNTGLEELKIKKEDLENAIDRELIPVKSEVAGVVSYYISGGESTETAVYEDITANKAAANLAPLSNLSENAAAGIAVTKVTKGTVVCNVIKSQDYYLIIKTSPEMVEQVPGELTVTNDETKYEAKGSVKYKVNDTIIFTTMRALKESMLFEKQNVSFDIASRTGYCVPLTALTDWDETGRTARLAIVKANYVQFIYVSVVATDGEKAIISSAPFSDVTTHDSNGEEIDNDAQFNASDCYVVNAKNVKEGQQITQNGANQL